MSGETLTFGAVAKRLRDAGYLPVSALGQRQVPHDALMDWHPAAVCISALILSPDVDEELRRIVDQVLDKRGLLEGPVRCGEDGCQIRPLNLTSYLNSGIEPVLEGAVAFGQGVTLPLSGGWPEGTLLEVDFAELPRIAPGEVLTLFREELHMLDRRLATKNAPPPRPSRRGWVGT